MILILDRGPHAKVSVFINLTNLKIGYETHLIAFVFSI